MKRRFRLTAALIVSFTLFQTTPTLAHVFDEVWETTDYDEHGFSMLMPPHSYLTAFPSEIEAGWVTLRGHMEGALFQGLASANVEAVPAELDALRTKLADWKMSWEVIDEGEGTSGWTWYQTFRGSIHGDSFFGGYGVGAKGSYVFLVKTSDGDFAIHRADYTKWFESITLDE